jgi:superoxide oxidase
MSIVQEPVLPAPPISRRFDTVTISFHWLTALLVTFMFATAWGRNAIHDREQAVLLLTAHRSLGVASWVTVIARVGWRSRYAFLPPWPPQMSQSRRVATKVSEFGLYVLLLIQPLTGFAQSLTRGRPFELFGFQVPSMMPICPASTKVLETVHGLTATVLLGIITVHALSALLHRFVIRDEILQSMLPWRTTTN